MSVVMPDFSGPVDSVLSTLADRGPGCVVGVVADGELAYTKAVGVANLEYDVPISPDTSFHVASVSKQFTAAAVALLSIRGDLSLDDDVRLYLPRMPWLGQPITLRHLVHHTSGLRDQYTLLGAAGWRSADLVTADDVLDLTYAQRTLNFEPGTAYSYSNTGYSVLAAVVETVAGMTLREFCYREFFGPLGMSDTHFHDDATEVVPGRAYSYAADAPDAWRCVPLNYSTVGATNLHSTVRDLARWVANSELQDPVGGEALWAKVLEVGTTTQGPTGYGFGLIIDDYRGTRRVRHGGEDAAFTSYLTRFPDLGVSFIILANGTNVSAPQIGMQVVDACLDTLGIATGGDSSAHDGSTAMQVAVDDFAGLFVDPSNGFSLRLEAESGALQLVKSSGRLDLDPVPGRGYKLPTGTLLTLDPPDEDGRRRLRASTMGLVDFVLDRAEPVAPDIEALLDYTGDYWSAELDVWYRLESDENRLTLRMRGFSPVPLTPMSQDVFAATFWNDSDDTCAVMFERSADGEVETMLATFPRSLRMSFQRLSRDEWPARLGIRARRRTGQLDGTATVETTPATQMTRAR